MKGERDVMVEKLLDEETGVLEAVVDDLWVL